MELLKDAKKTYRIVGGNPAKVIKYKTNEQN